MEMRRKEELRPVQMKLLHGNLFRYCLLIKPITICSLVSLSWSFCETSTAKTLKTCLGYRQGLRRESRIFFSPFLVLHTSRLLQTSTSLRCSCPSLKGCVNLLFIHCILAFVTSEKVYCRLLFFSPSCAFIACLLFYEDFSC